MSKYAIEIDNLSKRYMLGAIGISSLRDSLQRNWGRWCKDRILLDNKKKHIWALKNFSLNVSKGEVVGVIGKNGAGKSTLLKLLSKITKPTEGFARIQGRVSSLLEVGTGFHPELTGRENIFLNGAILGMKKTEITEKLNEIIAFSEIEKFIDTPVKRYSSGMYVRLAFSVAAHLESEILLIDEVLAVGDVSFQRKCLEKMSNLTKGGRTVIFISHNMTAISQLCERCIYLKEGEIQKIGKNTDVIREYLSDSINSEPQYKWNSSEAPGNKDLRLNEIMVENSKEAIQKIYDISEKIIFKMKFEVLVKDLKIRPLIRVFNAQGVKVFVSTVLHINEYKSKAYDPGIYQAVCIIPNNFLNEGKYFITVILTDDKVGNEFLVWEKNIISFDIYDSGKSEGSFSGGYGGVVRPYLDWNIKKDMKSC